MTPWPIFSKSPVRLIHPWSNPLTNFPSTDPYPAPWLYNPTCPCWIQSLSKLFPPLQNPNEVDPTPMVMVLDKVCLPSLTSVTNYFFFNNSEAGFIKSGDPRSNIDQVLQLQFSKYGPQDPLRVPESFSGSTRSKLFS